MLTCHQVANYFLAKQDEESGDLISNLKLQKLTYYAQGFHLAIHGKPLFLEPIFAWTHGPVVAELYYSLSAHGANAIPRPNGIDLAVYSDEVRGVLDEVHSVYGQFSAWKLRNMTHEEPPWATTNLSAMISHAKLEAYFKTQLE